MKRTINKVAILGSGVMGSRIACHFANIGVEVLLLDIVPKEASDSNQKKARNQIVDGALMSALKAIHHLFTESLSQRKLPQETSMTT